MNARELIIHTLGRPLLEDWPMGEAADKVLSELHYAAGWDGDGPPPAVVILGDGTLKRLEPVPIIASIPPTPVTEADLLFRLVDPEDPQ